jgi:hypothetical protein
MISDTLSVGVVCAGAVAVLAYLLGHYHGFEAGFDAMRQPYGDWPKIPLHSASISEGAQSDHA